MTKNRPKHEAITLTASLTDNFDFIKNKKIYKKSQKIGFIKRSNYQPKYLGKEKYNL